MFKTGCLLLLLTCAGTRVAAQPALEELREGNRYYREKNYGQALAHYDAALKSEPGNFTALFNKANALCKLNRAEEAPGGWAAAAAGVKDKALIAKAVYNQGVLLAKAEKLPECIETFKEALRNDPADKEARENLQKALLEWKKKQPPPRKDNKPKPKPQPKPQPQMKKEEAEQRLKLLEQKEKQVQQRMQQQKNQAGGSRNKDW